MRLPISTRYISINTLVERQGLQISCIEEIAWRKDWIDDAQLTSLCSRNGKSSYSTYLRNLLKR